jgi:hypothetical protein
MKTTNNKMKSEAIKEQIDKLQKDLKETQDYEQKLSSGSPVAIATYMHEVMCQNNHVDGCSWGYETWDCTNGDRARWLKRAKKLLANAAEEGITPSQVVLMVKWVNER